MRLELGREQGRDAGRGLRRVCAWILVPWGWGQKMRGVMGLLLMQLVLHRVTAAALQFPHPQQNAAGREPAPGREPIQDESKKNHLLSWQNLLCPF